MSLLPLHRPDKGVLFVVSGPSGVGKSTLLSAAMDRIPGLVFSVSATTRSPRPGEVDGVDYHFIKDAAFVDLIAQGAFVEHAQVYDRRYGTLRASTAAALSAGDSLILDIDVQGAAQVRAHLPDAVHLMILPPSLEALEQRLRARQTDSDEVIRRRMQLVQGQLQAIASFDYLIMNDDLETAHAVFQGILLAELSRSTRRTAWVSSFRASIASSV